MAQGRVILGKGETQTWLSMQQQWVVLLIEAFVQRADASNGVIDGGLARADLSHEQTPDRRRGRVPAESGSNAAAEKGVGA